VLFKKLFQLLVLGGAVASTASGCATRAEAQTAPAKGGLRDGGTAPDGGMGNNAAGTGGVKGW
jgi:hypothetical protein